MWRGAQRDNRCLEVGPTFLRDPLDDDDHVERPIVKQCGAILGRASIPHLPDVSRLVNDPGQSLPRIFVGMRKALRLSHGAFCCRNLAFGGLQFCDECVVIGGIPRTLRQPRHRSCKRLVLSLALRQARACLLDQKLRLFAPLIAVVEEIAHIALETLARAFANDQVLDTGLDLAGIDAPNAAASRVHPLVKLGLCTTLRIRVRIAALAALLGLVAPPVVFQAAVRADGSQRIGFALSAVSAATIDGARGEFASHVLEEIHIDHWRPVCGYFVTRALTSAIRHVLHPPD